MYRICLLLLCVLCGCTAVTVNVQTSIIGPWRQVEVNGKHISSNIVKRTFVSKLVFEEDEIIDEEEQIDTITNMAGLTDIEMKSIGQVNIPVFAALNLIKRIKLSGNEITQVQAKSFSQITPTYIDLQKNHINHIDTGAFGYELKTLILNCNELTTVSSTWFTDTDSLQSLHLSGNKITVIPENFNVFTGLWELHMSYNKLREIKDGALAQKHYTYIDISYNLLRQIKASYFSAKHVDINYLNLRANKLNFLPHDFMNKTSITVELTADLNPWLCPCNDLIRNWLPKIVLYNQKNSWLDKQAEGHAHRQDAYCVNDAFGSRECIQKIDPESTEYYFENIEPFDLEACPEY